MGDPTRVPASGKPFAPGGDASAARRRGSREALLDASLDCVALADDDGRITAINAPFERAFGRRREDVVGRRLAEVILPAWREDARGDGFGRFVAAEWELVLGKRVEVTAARADGSEFAAEVAATRAADEGGGFLVVTLREVGDRARAEHERRRAAWERLEEEHASHARAAALRADVSGSLARAVSMREMLQGCAAALVTHLEVAFARIWTLRRGRDELELQASAGAYTRLDGAYSRVRVGDFKIGLIARDRTPYLTNEVLSDPRIEDRAWARREGMVAFAGYPLVVEDRVVGVMAMFARHALAPETLEALASVAASIAQGVERKRSEEELRRSEAYLAEGQRLSHTGSWGWNFATGEIFWSLEMFRIYGFDPADGTPPYAAVLARAHPDDAPGVDQSLRDAFGTGTELRMLTRILAPGQPMKWVETYGHPVRGDDGSLLEFIGTVVDVTERVRANRRRRAAIKARYEAVLAERARIARDMHDGLLQDVTGIALQLRALLPHVRTSPDAAAETLARTLAQAERAGREARRALVGMRAGAEAGDVVRGVESAAHRAAAQGSVALEVTVTGRVPPVRADVCDAAAAIVHEAVTNVVRHAGARTVEIRLTFGRSRMRLTVRDDGRGMPPGASDEGHFGLVGMRERAAGIGAALTVTSVPAGGTVVRLDAPCPR